MTELAERKDTNPDSNTPADISAAERVMFIQLIRQGFNAQEAALQVGHKPRHFRSLRSPKSSFFDEEFRNDYEEAMGSYEHADSMRERLRAEIWRAAMTGEYRAMRDLAMIHLEEWSVMREKSTNINIQVFIRELFKGQPIERIDQIMAWLDQEEVSDADYRELPAGDSG